MSQNARLPRNLHLVTTLRSRANAILTKHATKMTSLATFPTGTATFCHHGRASVTGPHATKCHACQAKQSGATLETSKNHPLCNFSHRHGNFLPRRSRKDGCRRLRTLADACGRLRTPKRRPANTPPSPDPQSVKPNPSLRIRE